MKKEVKYITFIILSLCTLIIGLGLSVNRAQASSDFQVPKSWQTHNGDGDHDWNVNKVPKTAKVPVINIWNKSHQGYTHHLITNNYFNEYHPRLWNFKTNLTNDEFTDLRPQAHNQITIKPLITLNRRTNLNKSHLINYTNVRLYNLESVPSIFKNNKFKIKKLSPQQTEVYENNEGVKVPSVKQANKFAHKHKMDSSQWMIQMIGKRAINENENRTDSQVMETYCLCNKSKHFYWHNKLYHTFFNIKFKILKGAQAINGIRYYYVKSNTNPCIIGWIPFYALSGNYNWLWNECINQSINTEYQFANSREFRQRYLNDLKNEENDNDYAPDPGLMNDYEDSEGDIESYGNIPLEVVIINLNYKESKKRIKIRNTYGYKFYYSIYYRHLYKKYKKEILKKSQEIYLKTPKRNRKYLLFNKYPTNYQVLSKGVYKSAGNLEQLIVDIIDLDYDREDIRSEREELKRDINEYKILRHSKNNYNKIVELKSGIKYNRGYINSNNKISRQNIKLIQRDKKILHWIK